MKKIFYTIIFILICLAGFGVGEKVWALEDDCTQPTSNYCVNMSGDQPCPGERLKPRGDILCYQWTKALGYSEAQANQWKCCAPRPTITLLCSGLIQPSGQGQTACYEVSHGANPCAADETAVASRQGTADLCKTTTGATMTCCVSKCSSQKNSGGQPGVCKGVYNAQPTAAATQFCADGETYTGIYDCFTLSPTATPELPSSQVCCLPQETGTVTGSGLLPGLLKCEDVVGASCKSRCATGETAYLNNSLDPTFYGVEQSKACSGTQKCCYNPKNNCTSAESKGQCRETCQTGEISAGTGFIDCFTGGNTDRSWKDCCIPAGATTNSNTPAPTSAPTSAPRIPLAGAYRGGTSIGFEGLKGFGDVKISVLIGRIIQSALGIIGALALLMTVYGGLILLSSRGGEGVKKGKDIITWSIIGVAVILGSYALVSFAITGLGGGGASGDTTFTGSPTGGTTTTVTNTNTATPAVAGDDCRTAKQGSCLLCQGTGSNPPTEQQKGDCSRYFTVSTSTASYASCDMNATGCADNQICCIPKAAPTPTSPQPDANGCYGTTAKGYSGCQAGTSSGAYRCCDCGTAPGTTTKTCKLHSGTGVVASHCGKGSYYCRD